MGAARHKTEVELVEVAASTPPPRGPEAPGRPARGLALTLLVVAVLLAIGGLVDSVVERRHREGLALLASSGVTLGEVDAQVAPRWRVATPVPELLWVDDDVLVTVAHVRGSQVVVGRDLVTGAERWRATFVSRLGTSRCTGQLDLTRVRPEGERQLLVCALRANPRLLGTHEAGTSLHVRSVRTGEVLAERHDDGALAGARLVGTDLLGVWAVDGTLEVRREDALTGSPVWRLPLPTHDPVLASAWVEVDAAGGLLLVGTAREVFAVDPAGTVVFSHAVAPPRQPMRLSVQPVGEDLFAVWQRRGRTWLPADLRAADGGVLIAGVGEPRRLVADDGSLGEVLLTRHPDGDILWDLGTRTKLWLARGEVRGAVVVDGIVVLEGEEGLEAVDPARRAPVWRVAGVEHVVGIARSGELVASLAGAQLVLVGLEPSTGRELWRAATGIDAPVRTAVVDGALFAVEPRAVSLLASREG